MLARRVERNELHRARIFARIERDPRAVAEQIERLAIGRELVRVRHGIAERSDGEACLRVPLHCRIDALDALDEDFLDQWVFQRAVEHGHRRLVAISPAEAGTAGWWRAVTGKPF